MIHNITEQEIEKLIGEKPKIEYVREVQSYLEGKEKLTSEELRNHLALNFYYRTLLHSEATTHLGENQLLGKIVAEMLLKEEGKTEPEITEILESNNWKEKTGFSVEEIYDRKDWEWKHKINLNSNQKTPKEIVKIVDEKIELTEQLLEAEAEIEELKKEKEFFQLSDKANLSGIRVAEEWWKREIAKVKDELNSEREDKLDLIQRLAVMTVENKKLVESWNEKHRDVKEETRKSLKKDEIIEELKEEIHLANKPLPKIPSKFKIFKQKTKTKFQNLIEKVKHQSHELVARIEVKTK